MSFTKHQEASGDNGTTFSYEDENVGESGENDNYDSYGGIVDNESSTNDTGGDNTTNAKAKDEITYAELLRTNPNFRYFLLSYVINWMGDWLTYLASISLIQRVTMRDDTNQNNANTVISVLLMVKLLPKMLVMPIGGILADSYDRRKVQVILDLCSSCAVVVFLWSLASESIFLCLLANFLLDSVSGLYIPSNKAMLPQIFEQQQQQGKNKSRGEGDKALKKATILYGMSWSLMAAIGSSLGGVLVAAFGIKGCFIIDSITYLASATSLQFGVKGNFNASLKATQSKDEKDNTSASEKLSLLEEQSRTEKDSSSDAGEGTGSVRFFAQGLKFLFFEEPVLGAVAMFKGTAALAIGGLDVLIVSFSARGSESDPSKTSLKLGLLFAGVGIGCILGMIITDTISDLAFPRRIARLCLGGFLSMSVSLFWMSATPDIFVSLCLSTVLRSIGASATHIASTLLIQKFTPQNLLGRVSSFESGFTMFGHLVSALGSGIIMDQKDISAEEMSMFLGVIALFFFFCWSPVAFRF